MDDHFEEFDGDDSGVFERSILHTGDLAIAIRVIHLRAVHAIREFAAKGGFGVVVSSRYPLRPYQELANACRSALAATLRVPPALLHCTISYCGGSMPGKATSNRKVWNFAHSDTNSGRNLLLGPDYGTVVGFNSAYAAILGCEDRLTAWEHRFPCFACDDLPDETYDDHDSDWRKWYRARLVFPLRYPTYDVKGLPVDNITGFLSYDTLHPELFRVPSIFDHRDDPAGYTMKHDRLAVCNAGGVIADCIAVAILQEKKLRKYRAIVRQGSLAKEKTGGSKNE